MTFLDLVKQLRQECGASGNITAVKNQVGEVKRLVDWTNQAWLEIQQRRAEWEFLMAEDSTLSTTLGGQTVGLPADYKAPIALTLTDGDTKHPIAFVDRATFNARMRLVVPQQQRPTLFTVVGNNIRFNTLADAAYPLALEYYKQPAPMVENTDLPGDLPEEYHWVIIYRAMMDYGEHDVAQEVFSRGQRGFNRLITRMEARLLPPIAQQGGGLA